MQSCDGSGFRRFSTGNSARWGWAASALIGAGYASPAAAHVRLLEPPSWVAEDFLGDPQKEGPCGTSSPSASELTGAVTTYHAGDVVRFRWLETIPHDGHYRVALAVTSRDELTDPKTTADENNYALTAEIQDPPVLPILMDGVYVHKANDVSLGQEYTLDVTLPDDVTCEKCTLQLTQFMANHAPGYFYYHCVDVTILAKEPVVDEDAGSASPSDVSVGDADAGSVQPSDATSSADLGAPSGPVDGPDATAAPDASGGPPMQASDAASLTDVAVAKGSSSGGCQAGSPGSVGLSGLVFGLVAWFAARRRKTT